MKTLANNKNLVINSPDKGRGVVIMNRDDYLQKMLQILNNSSKFIKLPNLNSFLTTLRLEDRVNKFLNKLCKAGIISDEQYKKLYVSGSSPGILYGLPKIHKPNLPMRPILAAYNTTVYKLSKFLVPLIEQFTVNEFF